MSIAIKVRQVQRVFEQLEKEVTRFQSQTGMHCLTGCGNCCSKPTIEAVPLEFLPLAFHLFLTRKTAEARHLLEKKAAVCYLFEEKGIGTLGNLLGRCSSYNHRGLICRLFGFSTVRDKQGQRILSTCKWIKQTQPDAILRAQQLIISAEPVPKYMTYYQKLVQIDFRLGQEYLPVNQAILRAIDVVEHYYQYRPFPYRHRKSA